MLVVVPLLTLVAALLGQALGAGPPAAVLALVAFLAVLAGQCTEVVRRTVRVARAALAAEHLS